MLGLFLGASLASGLSGHSRRGPGGLPPRLLRLPALGGSAVIGGVVALDPGDWSDAETVEVQWHLDGRDLPGATGADFRPDPAHDRAALGARVTARNAAGATTAEAARTVAVKHRAPSVSTAIPDKTFLQHSGEQTLDASSAFTGAALTFSVTGDGVTVDPQTGTLRIATDALRDGITVSVTGANSGGEAVTRFTLTVAAAESPPAGSPPVLVEPPALSGSGMIGEPLTADPGTWEGDPEPLIAYAWLRDGAPIAGAEEQVYIPGPEDDGASIACLITAANAAGRAEAEAGPVAVAYAPPAAVGALDDILLVEGDSPATVAAASAFEGAALVFAAEGAGVEIDAATGIVTVTADTLRDGETVTVTATNSGGSASTAFRVTVAAAGPLPAAPILVAAPALAGTGKIGTEVALEPGLWSGEPKPALAYAWCRDGAPIAGATGPSYLAAAEDDRTALTCRVTAANASGSAVAETAALAITHVAPAATAEIPDEILDEGEGVAQIETAWAFEGEALVFAAEGAGATIDPETGIVSVPTETPFTGETVTVTASNSGGSASVAFLVTVEAAEIEVTPGIAEYCAAAIPGPGSSFREARDVGPHMPGRLVWVMVIANTAPTISINGTPVQPVEAGAAGSAVGHLYVSDTTASQIEVAHSGASLATPCVLWFTTLGYAAEPAAVARAGEGASNQTPASVNLAVPQGGAILAGGRNFNLLPAPSDLQKFTVGYNGGGITAGVLDGLAGGTVTVTAARDAGAVAGKHLIAVALRPVPRPGDAPPSGGVEAPAEPSSPTAPGTPIATQVVTQIVDGPITWRFAQPTTVFQYADGGWGALAPCTLAEAAPASRIDTGWPSGFGGTGGNSWINGMMGSPRAAWGGPQGFIQWRTSRNGGSPAYDHDLNIDPGARGPLTITQPRSLFKCVTRNYRDFPGWSTNLELTRTLAAHTRILTVVTQLPNVGALTPAFNSTAAEKNAPHYEQEIPGWNSGYSGFLRSLPMSNVGAPSQAMLDWLLNARANVMNAATGPWGSYFTPAPPGRSWDYGDWRGEADGAVLMWLHSNATAAQKRQALLRLMRHGREYMYSAYPKMNMMWGISSTGGGLGHLGCAFAAYFGHGRPEEWRQTFDMDWGRGNDGRIGIQPGWGGMFSEMAGIWEVSEHTRARPLVTHLSSMAWRPQSAQHEADWDGMPDWFMLTASGPGSTTMDNMAYGRPLMALYRFQHLRGSMAAGTFALLCPDGTNAVEGALFGRFIDYIDRMTFGWMLAFDTPGVITDRYTAGGANSGDARYQRYGEDQWNNYPQPGFRVNHRTHRALGWRPRWTGKAEPPRAPYLSNPSSGQVRVQWSGVAMVNNNASGHAFVRREFRFRVNNGAWSEPQNVGSSTDHTFFPGGGGSRTVDVQCRLVTAHGPGLWSRNGPHTQSMPNDWLGRIVIN